MKSVEFVAGVESRRHLKRKEDKSTRDSRLQTVSPKPMQVGDYLVKYDRHRRLIMKSDKTSLIGARHGNLTVIAKSPIGTKRWICKCDCGNTRELMESRFRTFLSCGCLEKENKRNIGERTKKHGMTYTILYSKYCGIKARCYNPNYKHYERYGGRGIVVAPEWLGRDGFLHFRDWAYANGYDESKVGYEQSIDRINIDGNYEPSNCRWVDQKVQARNRNITLKLIYQSEEISLGEFCEENNINYDWARRRVHKGQSGERILEDWLKRQIEHERVHK